MISFTSTSMTLNYGRKPESADVGEQARQMLEEASRLCRTGELDRAEQLCGTLIGRHPQYVGALHTMGLVYVARKQFDRALPFLVRAVIIHPSDWRLLAALGNVQFKVKAHEAAALTLRAALRLKPDEPALLAALGEIHTHDQDYEAAIAVYERAVELDPALTVAVSGLAHALYYVGDLSRSAALAERLIAQGRWSISTLLRLAMLPKSLVRADLLSLADEARADETDAENFEAVRDLVRGIALGNAGRHGEAWQALAAANRLMHERTRHDIPAERERQAHTLRQAEEAAPAVFGDDHPREPPMSLFILGPSRSGKTSLERLVAGLDGARAGYESPIVRNAVHNAIHSAGYLLDNWLAPIPPALFGAWRDRFVDELEQRARGARLLTCTSPQVLHKVLEVAAALPRVRFVFVNRDPDDLAFRIFGRIYESDHPYAYDLGSIRDHIAWYDRTGSLLAEKLPAISLVVRYEDLVADPAGELARVARLCGMAPPKGPLPPVDDDRGAAMPYRRWMAKS